RGRGGGARWAGRRSRPAPLALADRHPAALADLGHDVAHVERLARVYVQAAERAAEVRRQNLTELAAVVHFRDDDLALATQEGLDLAGRDGPEHFRRHAGDLQPLRLGRPNRPLYGAGRRTPAAA